MRTLLLAALVAVSIGAAASSAKTFSSGEKPVPLVELFTSEGCSSCPPAERWMGELRNDERLWRDFVPVAWHVNYWDRLGWPDKFAEKAYTDRQYAYAEQWKARSVYTPGLVRGGDEWRIRDGGLIESGSAEGGALNVSVTGETVSVGFDTAKLRSNDLRVNVARLGGGIASNVRSGENRGKKLEHEFLVLGWSQQPLRAGKALLPLPEKDPTVNAPRQAIAVWISRADDPTPLQATGGWLD
ncbi:DUF1223 domain-containing protein [Opitutaceae bacterium]|nr:DUF1223 domain-containing protein [Opitutaceae bacterium]